MCNEGIGLFQLFFLLPFLSVQKCLGFTLIIEKYFFQIRHSRLTMSFSTQKIFYSGRTSIIAAGNNLIISHVEVIILFLFIILISSHCFGICTLFMLCQCVSILLGFQNLIIGIFHLFWKILKHCVLKIVFLSS